MLFEEAVESAIYERVRTYLCRSEDGEPSPGEEPEAEWAATILDTRWFDLRSPDTWLPEILADELTMRWVRPVRARLGYA